MPKVSIIVPVYKAEAFLDPCVRSILSQTLRDLELLLIDDGSPDRSGEKCDHWAREDSRVRVIHQKNAGVSAARNRGLQEARGQFIGFVDADDRVEPRMFEVLTEQIGSRDLIMCDAVMEYSDGSRSLNTMDLLPETRDLSHGDCRPELMLEFAGTVWRCLYRRQLLEDHGIRFPVGLKFSEDRVFNLYAMGYAREIRYLKEPLYIQFCNLESCVNTFHPDYAIHGKRAAEETARAITLAWEDSPQFQSAFLEQYSGTFYNSLNQLRQKHCPLNFFQRLGKVKEICNNSDFRDILKEKGYGGREGQLILRKRYLHVYFYECPLDLLLLNVQEEFRLEGFSGVIRKTLHKLF